MTTPASELLSVKDLWVTFAREGTLIPAVRGVDLSIQRGEWAALVGESGCGKSVTALSLAELPPTDRAALRGAVELQGKRVDRAGGGRPRRIRGQGVAYVFQEPAASLNPVLRIRTQVLECIRGMPRGARRERGLSLLEQVHLPDPAAVWRAYPGELSGGMQQRVVIAMALACKPALLVADEPTTALDVTTQARILDLLDELRRELRMGVLHITHNLGLVAGYADRVHVMYAGRIVESGDVEGVLRAPAHPYTAGLLRAVPKLDAASGEEVQGIRGQVPHPSLLPPGCAFAPRCDFADAQCGADEPAARGRPGDPGGSVRCWHPLVQEGEHE